MNSGTSSQRKSINIIFTIFFILALTAAILITASIIIGNDVLPLLRGSVTEDVSGSLNAMRTVTLFAVGLLAVILVFILAAANNLRKAAAKSAENLENAVNQMNAGDLSVKVNVVNEETAQLSGGVNELAAVFGNLLADIGKQTADFQNGKYDTRLDVRKYKGNYAQAAENVNKTIEALIKEAENALEAVKAISEGDFSAESKSVSGKTALFSKQTSEAGENLKKVKTIITTAHEGALSGKAGSRSGYGQLRNEWASLFEEVDLHLSNMVNPVKDFTDSLNYMARGDFSRKITAKSTDALEPLRTALNLALENISGYINETADFLERLEKGEYGITVTRSFQGDFSRVRQAANSVSASLKDMKQKLQQETAKNSVVPKAPVSSGLFNKPTVTKPAVFSVTPAKTVGASKPFAEKSGAIGSSAGKRKTVPSMAHVYEQTNFGKY
ncbi:MAG: hypothetical protein LBS21_08280 [Clostridiales bacterium]|jgi:methyl-accepting chemotaxis protein|nr:hypothetical protein [Clostridiales bacterium]